MWEGNLLESLPDLGIAKRFIEWNGSFASMKHHFQISLLFG